MPRFHLKGLMVAVLAAAIVLGIGMAFKRRSMHYQRLYLAESLEAQRLVGEMPKAPDKLAIARLLRKAHWHNWVGAEYHKIALTPWQVDHCDPATVACRDFECGGRYPGGVINDDLPLDLASP